MRLSSAPRTRTALDFGKRLWREVQRDQVSNGAAALAFYMMLAVFPAAIFGLSLLPYLPVPNLTQALFDLLYQLMPREAAQLFTATVRRITSERNGGLLSFGLLFATWSGSTGLYAVMQQLNVVYDVEEERPFWRARAVALLLMLIFFVLVVTTFALVIFGGMLQDWLGQRLGFGPVLLGFFALFRWVVITIALLVAFAVTYQLGPNLQKPFRLLSPGNVFACLGLLLASFGFKLYVGHFGRYDATYGSLGAVIVLLLWLFLMGWVLLIGGELNQLLEDGKHHSPASPGRATRASGPREPHPAPSPNARGSTTPKLALASRALPELIRAARFAPHEDDGKVSIVVWAGLLTNIGLAIAKFIAATLSGSSALLSEAIHSTADTGNELLLILGVRLSRRPADRLHPFGRGQEIYFWGLIVAMLLFSLGGGMSLYEGVQHVLYPSPLEYTKWNYIVLGCALLFEGTSFTIAARKMHSIAKAQGESFFESAHSSKNPQHFVVLFEDAAAILGVFVAFAGIYAAEALNEPILDGIASIVIGVILATAALFLAYECRSLLIGESADFKKVEDIRAIAARDPSVRAVSDPLTVHLGPEDVLLNLEVDFRDDLDVTEIETSVQRLENAIRERHPEVRKIFIEVRSLVPDS